MSNNSRNMNIINTGDMRGVTVSMGDGNTVISGNGNTVAGNNISVGKGGGGDTNRTMGRNSPIFSGSKSGVNISVGDDNFIIDGKTIRVPSGSHVEVFDLHDLPDTLELHGNLVSIHRAIHGHLTVCGEGRIFLSNLFPGSKVTIVGDGIGVTGLDEESLRFLRRVPFNTPLIAQESSNV